MALKQYNILKSQQIAVKKQAAQTDNMMEQVIRNSPTPVKGYVGGATPVRVMQKNKKIYL